MRQIAATMSPQMDKATKIILATYCTTVTLIVLIVPWSRVRRDVRFDREYSFLLSEPPGKSIDFGMIALEITAVSAVAVISYLFREPIGQLPVDRLCDNANRLGQKTKYYWYDESIALLGLGNKRFRCSRITMLLLAALLCYLLYGLLDEKVIPKEVFLLLNFIIMWRLLYLL